MLKESAEDEKIFTLEKLKTSSILKRILSVLN